jgi:hypothetical protein
VVTASAAAAEEEPLEGEAGPVDWNAFKLLGSEFEVSQGRGSCACLGG